MKRVEAKVVWFNRRDGEGLARSKDGENPIRLGAGGIPGRRTWFNHTACVYYKPGQVITVETLDLKPYYRCLTAGTFDKTKWDSLDHERLAFRCNADGEAVTGLFASKKKKQA